MQITITARHFELTNAIRDYVESACEKLDRYFDQIINLHVILTLDNTRNICEISLHASKFSLQSESEENDMYVAIDTTVDRMENQLKKLKDKVTDHKKKSLSENSGFSRTSLFKKEDSERKLIKTKKVIPEYMTTDEAVDKLDDGKDYFIIFKNVETDKINVLVKKDEDHYKLLEP
ncbi:MAG: ribosome-associated translation inhibitor RaiA [Candidatus Cloacimonetes bacterium]|nr:ribosome-associated translation inhibitor RaiA [Candidatus Cloacimonadota bacterium]